MDMENEYWWVWLGIGVNLAYILLMNVVIIICLAYLPGESWPWIDLFLTCDERMQTELH